MPDDPTTLQVIAENYGLPGMVLFSLALLIGFMSFGLPRLIKAIRGDGETKKVTSDDTPTPEKKSRRSGPGHLTRAFTRDEVAKAKDDLDERLDLKLAPLMLLIEGLKKEQEAGRDRDKEHYGKLDILTTNLGKLDTRLARVEATIKVRHEED